MDRTMFRGDTLFFLAQIFVDPTSGQISSWPVNGGPPGLAPANITSLDRIVFTLKYTFVDPDLAAVMQLDNVLLGGVVVIAATSGQYSVTGLPTRTYAFPDSPVELVYDVQVTDALGRIFTVESGTFTVNPDATRAIV